jgi:hypothetical protein
MSIAEKLTSSPDVASFLDENCRMKSSLGLFPSISRCGAPGGFGSLMHAVLSLSVAQVQFLSNSPHPPYKTTKGTCVALVRQNHGPASSGFGAGKSQPRHIWSADSGMRFPRSTAACTARTGACRSIVWMFETLGCRIVAFNLYVTVT